MYGLKIKSSVDHNEYDKTNINENDTRIAHTTLRVRLPVALPSESGRRVEGVLVSPHDPGTWHEGSF